MYSDAVDTEIHIIIGPGIEQPGLDDQSVNVGGVNIAYEACALKDTDVTIHCLLNAENELCPPSDFPEDSILCLPDFTSSYLEMQRCMAIWTVQRALPCSPGDIERYMEWGSEMAEYFNTVWVHPRLGLYQALRILGAFKRCRIPLKCAFQWGYDYEWQREDNLMVRMDTQVWKKLLNRPFVGKLSEKDPKVDTLTQRFNNVGKMERRQGEFLDASGIVLSVEAYADLLHSVDADGNNVFMEFPEPNAFAQ